MRDWRRDDTARNRPKLSVPWIVNLQRLALLDTEKLAKETGARMITIWNRPDNVEKNVNTIEGIAHELFSNSLG